MRRLRLELILTVERPWTIRVLVLVEITIITELALHLLLACSIVVELESVYRSTLRVLRIFIKVLLVLLQILHHLLLLLQVFVLLTCFIQFCSIEFLKTFLFLEMRVESC